MLRLLVLAALLPGAAIAERVPVQAQVQAPERQVADQLWQVMRMDQLMEIIRDEAVAEATRLQDEGVIAGAGQPWPQIVHRIHDPEELEDAFREGLSGALGRLDAAQVEAGLRFYRSALGRRLLDLEASARRAMLTEGIEDQGREAFMRDLTRGGARSAAIRRIIRDADLVTPNVESGLNATVAFSQGFAEGGGYDMPPDEGQMLADAWEQQPQIEAEAAAWLEGFFMIAYAPVEDEDLDAYGEFAVSDRGRALARAMFAGFDRIFSQTSYRMGLAAALRSGGREL
ncbi:DUF2059 domain-containing protein [Paracoccus sp. PARArs4]|uniref:DUF2059 domain-containing protein n=1 Tax=Paracoccus sp. PARArs4 TaxID=2853442 RepID=UPI0024A73D81|nr:DUF2059 domain-containing protein [Paracoccus sp. PARArs4]